MTAIKPNIHVVAPTATHTHTIIFLHGRGSTATEFESEFFESQASDDRFFTQIFPGIKWVFPCAAMRHAEVDNEEMCQWFDMASVQRPNERMELQEQGLQESVEFLLRVLKDESAEVPMDRIFLGGISQGCATAIHALLQNGARLGGFIGLCSWLPFEDAIQEIVQKTSSPTQRINSIRQLLSLDHDTEDPIVLQTPVFLSHSEDDGVVPVANGKALCDGLKALGMTVEMSCYPDGGHWVNEPKGVDGIVAFIESVMERSGF
ncbi:alpha/beta-hydrolase [Mytilinidion resinicola]|uniref:Alpha/beta-hydrolase n=1 Tax=Mytilinidion resinicola TaxID=574789 RepID=A0A6A6Y9T3_9PEZI|nr:alpha/beta-hydrolase [Mytilinidion resinicola]KAF2804875.1 alpha/beta-hydrolase [Mytilinidion resinicola]